MASYEIHRGIGRPLELLGLKSIYIFLLPLAVGISIIMYFLMTICSISVTTSLVLSFVTGIVLVYTVLFFNKKYGEKGFSMLIAWHLTPKQIINDKRLFYEKQSSKFTSVIKL